MTPTQTLVIAAMPGTLAQIATTIGKSTSTAALSVKSLRKAKASHIGGWVMPDGGKPTAVHHAGPGEDAVCELAYAFPKKAPPNEFRIPARDAITTALFGPRDTTLQP